MTGGYSAGTLMISEVTVVWEVGAETSGSLSAINSVVGTSGNLSDLAEATEVGVVVVECTGMSSVDATSCSQDSIFAASKCRSFDCVFECGSGRLGEYDCCCGCCG